MQKKIGFGISVVALVFLSCLSLIYGIKPIPLSTILDSFFHFNGSTEHLIVQTARLPRTILAVLVGASLAMAGAILQAVTRNPLASPATLGINAGASFFVVLAIFLNPDFPFLSLIFVSFFGAVITVFLVFLIASFARDSYSFIPFVLAGASVSALFASLTQGLLVMNEKGLAELLFWLAGSVEGRSMEMVQYTLPFFVLGWIGSAYLSRHLLLLEMGDEIVRGLGQNPRVLKGISLTVIVLLAGSSVAVAGPIPFVGLIVPHIVRKGTGPHDRWFLPCCFVTGAILLLSADLLGRFLMHQQEIPAGIMTAMIGAPFLIRLARRK